MRILSSYLESLRSQSYTVYSLKEIKEWIFDSNEKVRVELNQTPLSQLNGWNYSPLKVSHDSGRFFSIEGLRVQGSVNDNRLEWDQPIINQPEHGYLGILVREFEGVLHFSRVHKGRLPDYLEDFTSPDPDSILVDQLQTEQGSRFLKKRNRNVIVHSDSVEALDDRFKWLSMWQIQQIMREDNIVNMDTRTVLSCLPFQFTQNHLAKLKSSNVNELISFNPLFSDSSMNSSDFIFNWLTQKVEV
jgi:oxidase EvaA